MCGGLRRSPNIKQRTLPERLLFTSTADQLTVA